MANRYMSGDSRRFAWRRVRAAVPGWARRLVTAPTILALAVAAASVSPDAAAVQSGVADWFPTAPMVTARSYHTATRLWGAPCQVTPRPGWCGKVLVVGGSDGGGVALTATTAAELYDPITQAWTPTAPLTVARASQSAVALPDGKVLVVGGEAGPTTAELYDPGRPGWTLSNLVQAREGGSPARPSVTVLDDGTVLVAGGTGLDGHSTVESELYDPRSNGWQRTGDLNVARHGQAFALVANGQVLVVGGEHTSTPDPLPQQDPATNSAEVFDPPTRSWHLVAPPFFPRDVADALRLADGRVIVAGGYTANGRVVPQGDEGAVQIYDPLHDTWSPTGRLATPPFVRSRPFMVLLPDGRVLAAHTSTEQGGAEVYDPASGLWTATGAQTSNREDGSVTLLGCDAAGGRVLLAGGVAVDRGASLASAELFNGVPTVQHVTNAQGAPVASTAGGTAVVIKGLALAPHAGGSVTVSFGGSTVTGTANAQGTQVDVTAPTATAQGLVAVGVTVGGVPAEVCADTVGPFVYAAPPTISGIDPPAVLAVGGEKVTVSGTDLGGALSVDGVAVTPTRTGATSVEFTSPPHDPGPVTVTVDNGIGRASTQLTYRPALSALMPASGPPEGGQLVQIKGKGLSGTTGVTFDGAAVASTVRSDGEVDVTTPAHPPGTVTVAVATSAGPAGPAGPGADQYQFGAGATTGLGTTSTPGGLLGPGGENPVAPLGGGGTGAGAPAGAANASTTGGFSTNSSPIVIVTPGPGGSLAAPGLSTSPPAIASLPAPGPAPAAPVPGQSSVPGPIGVAAGSGGGEAEGAPHYAMVTQPQSEPPGAATAIGGAVLLLLCCCVVRFSASPARRAGAASAADRPRRRYAY